MSLNFVPLHAWDSEILTPEERDKRELDNLLSMALAHLLSHMISNGVTYVTFDDFAKVNTELVKDDEKNLLGEFEIAQTNDGWVLRRRNKDWMAPKVAAHESREQHEESE